MESTLYARYAGLRSTIGFPALYPASMTLNAVNCGLSSTTSTLSNGEPESTCARLFLLYKVR